jgi:hypothetical protein
VKKCLLIAVSELCPDKKSVFVNISLSRMTVQRRVTDISNNLSNQLRKKAEEFKYYSLAMDQCTDTAQLLIFIRGTDENFAIIEELAGLCSMKGRTTGKEIADEVIKCVTVKIGLTFDNLVAVCTTGAPFMRGKVLFEGLLWKNIVTPYMVISPFHLPLSLLTPFSFPFPRFLP